MFNKKEWVVNSLKRGYDKGLWTGEHIMENAMKYSMAGVLDDADLEELALYTEPVIEEEVISQDTGNVGAEEAPEDAISDEFAKAGDGESDEAEEDTGAEEAAEPSLTDADS